MAERRESAYTDELSASALPAPVEIVPRGEARTSMRSGVRAMRASAPMPLSQGASSWAAGGSVRTFSSLTGLFECHFSSGLRMTA